MYISYYYLQSFFDNNANRTFIFSQLIVFLKECLTFMLINRTKFTTKETSLSHIDADIQSIQHGFYPLAYHLFL